MPTARLRRRPLVVAAVQRRLDQRPVAPGDRRWLVGSAFTVADPMMASVLKIARALDLLDERRALAADQDRCLDRPACRRAIDDRCATIAQHAMADVTFDEVGGG